MPQAHMRIRVAFVDVDASQRIHYTAMFRYMEVAEHTLMRAIGFPYATTLRDTAFPRVHLSCDFRGAIAFDDLIDIAARVVKVGTSSWTVAFTARLAMGDEPADNIDGQVVAEGEMTIVAMDPSTERATPIPPALRHALMGD